VARAAEIGIIVGRTNNRFDPSGSATRAEAAVVLVNMLKDKP
jgi:S-layer homology domain.